MRRGWSGTHGLYLSEHSLSDAKRLPDLNQLDVNMPQEDGRQALIESKSEPALQDIPIVILTTFELQEDVDLTLKAGAELFITNTGDFR